ncbi:MAG: hypothetical protein N2Z62_14390 [Rhodobacteraceae bacterium]|nr:hypothetical protein [Paracoccaceae bacterium]
MLKTAAILAVAIAAASPAAASDEQIVRNLGVAPGQYTLAELVQLMNSSKIEARKRAELIAARRAAFEEAVRSAVNGGAYAPEVTRAAR